MKTNIIILLLACIGLLSCSDDDESVLIPVDRGTVTDVDGNVYEWVRIGDLEWTTSNAKCGSSLVEATYRDLFNEEQYVFYSDEEMEHAEEYMEEYGNLLTYADAVVSAPDGWRLPTDEDWKSLERSLGMGDMVDKEGWRGRGVASLLMQSGEGTTELNMRMGGALLWTAEQYGGMIVNLINEGIFAYYWTSTIDESCTDNECAYYRKFTVSRTDVERQSTRTNDRRMSVRWVRDAE